MSTATLSCTSKECCNTAPLCDIGDGHVINATVLPEVFPSYDTDVHIKAVKVQFLDPCGLGVSEAIREGLAKECAEVTRTLQGLCVSSQAMKDTYAFLLDEAQTNNPSMWNIPDLTVFSHAAWSIASDKLRKEKSSARFMMSSLEKCDRNRLVNDRRVDGKELLTLKTGTCSSSFDNTGDGLIVNICATTGEHMPGLLGSHQPKYLFQILDPFKVSTASSLAAAKATMDVISKTLPSQITGHEIQDGILAYAKDWGHSKACEKVTGFVGLAQAVYDETQRRLATDEINLNFLVSTPTEFHRNAKAFDIDEVTAFTVKLGTTEWERSAVPLTAFSERGPFWMDMTDEELASLLHQQMPGASQGPGDPLEFDMAPVFSSGDTLHYSGDLYQPPDQDDGIVYDMSDAKHSLDQGDGMVFYDMTDANNSLAQVNGMDYNMTDANL